MANRGSSETPVPDFPAAAPQKPEPRQTGGNRNHQPAPPPTLGQHRGERAQNAHGPENRRGKPDAQVLIMTQKQHGRVAESSGGQSREPAEPGPGSAAEHDQHHAPEHDIAEYVRRVRMQGQGRDHPIPLAARPHARRVQAAQINPGFGRQNSDPPALRQTVKKKQSQKDQKRGLGIGQPGNEPHRTRSGPVMRFRGYFLNGGGPPTRGHMQPPEPSMTGKSVRNAFGRENQGPMVHGGRQGLMPGDARKLLAQFGFAPKPVRKATRHGQRRIPGKRVRRPGPPASRRTRDTPGSRTERRTTGTRR